MVHFLCTVHIYDVYLTLILNASKASNMKYKTISKQEGPTFHFFGTMRLFYVKLFYYTKGPPVNFFTRMDVKKSQTVPLVHFSERMWDYETQYSFLNTYPPTIFSILSVFDVISEFNYSTKGKVEVRKFCAISDFLTFCPNDFKVHYGGGGGSKQSDRMSPSTQHSAFPSTKGTLWGSKHFYVRI